MMVDPAILVLFLTAVIGLQGWTLKTVVDLKAEVAAIKEHCRLCSR